MSSRPRPEWVVPNGTYKTGLSVSNSLTNRKDEFIPAHGKQVKWYICGPTVYDSSHLGHARTYLSFDIIRRILEDYFGYDVQVCMNITDIDDKIIMRSRRNYLFDEYVKKVTSLSSLSNSEGETIRSDLQTAMKVHLTSLQTKHDLLATSISTGKRTAKEAGPELNLAKEKLEKANVLSARLLSSLATLEVGQVLHDLLNDMKDALCDHLDVLNGSKLSHEILNRITKEHSQFYEREFLDDMKQLGIKTPDALTRVSEFVPEIIEMCQKIIANGFAYESDGSVYFDVATFDKAKDHYYAKLLPSAYGNTDLLSEGEGGLTATGEKKSPNDFALWKKSKAGEPVWNGPWGLGRPGWHIECSAMAGKVLGQNIDIHAGGCDLKFPHHDNELAQSEAYFGVSLTKADGSTYSQWVNYFLHTGHLHIDNLKMSKSLKNFVTIREVLASHSARQVRLLFLLQSWDNNMNFQRTGTMNEVSAKEKSFQEFFLKVEQVLGERIMSQGASEEHWNDKDFELNTFITQTQQNVHSALCNNFDTASVMKHLSDMVTKSNVYMEKNTQKKAFLLKKAAVYLTKILKVFGVIGEQVGNQEFGFGAAAAEASTCINPRDVARPYVNALVEFRKQVRSIAKESGAAKELLMKLSDSMRDDIMPELDVKIVDDGEFGFFFVDKETLKREKLERLAAEETVRRAKKLGALQKKEKDLQKWLESSETPESVVKRRFNVSITSGDVESWPQTDSEGKELNKTQKKNMKKEWDKQEKNHAKYKEELAKTPTFLEELKSSVSLLKTELGIN